MDMYRKSMIATTKATKDHKDRRIKVKVKGKGSKIRDYIMVSKVKDHRDKVIRDNTARKDKDHKDSKVKDSKTKASKVKCTDKVSQKSNIKAKDLVSKVNKASKDKGMGKVPALSSAALLKDLSKSCLPSLEASRRIHLTA